MKNIIVIARKHNVGGQTAAWIPLHFPVHYDALKVTHRHSQL